MREGQRQPCPDADSEAQAWVVAVVVTRASGEVAGEDHPFFDPGYRWPASRRGAGGEPAASARTNGLEVCVSPFGVIPAPRRSWRRPAPPLQYPLSPLHRVRAEFGCAGLLRSMSVSTRSGRGCGLGVGLDGGCGCEPTGCPGRRECDGDDDEGGEHHGVVSVIGEDRATDQGPCGDTGVERRDSHGCCLTDAIAP